MYAPANVDGPDTGMGDIAPRHLPPSFPRELLPARCPRPGPARSAALNDSETDDKMGPSPWPAAAAAGVRCLLDLDIVLSPFFFEPNKDPSIEYRNFWYKRVARDPWDGTRASWDIAVRLWKTVLAKSVALRGDIYTPTAADLEAWSRREEKPFITLDNFKRFPPPKRPGIPKNPTRARAAWLKQRDYLRKRFMWYWQMSHGQIWDRADRTWKKYQERWHHMKKTEHNRLTLADLYDRPPSVSTRNTGRLATLEAATDLNRGIREEAIASNAADVLPGPSPLVRSTAVECPVDGDGPLQPHAVGTMLDKCARLAKSNLRSLEGTISREEALETKLARDFGCESMPLPRS